MFSLQTVVAIFACSFALGSCTKFTDCGSKGGSITKLTVPDCDAGPCVFKKGSSVSFEMDFTANEDISAATTKITAYLGPIPVPFSPSDTNSCHFMTCPIKKGGNVVFKQGLPILAAYPSISAKVQWSLMKGDEIITCFQIDAKIE